MIITMKIEPEILEAVKAAEETTGGRCYVVGGYIRNMILGRRSDDIDFVVEGDSLLFAEETARNLKRKKVVKFPRFKTARIDFKGRAIEFVSARSEEYITSSRKPLVKESTLKDDLSRRDFTINAMAARIYGEECGEIIDHYGGLDDINRKIIRTPLDADITYSDDPLRMMRAIRFASVLDFNIERKSFEAIRTNAERINIVSAERISDEFMKIISSSNPVKGILFLERSGLMKIILPEISALSGVEDRDGLRHKDVFIHTLKVLYNLSRTTEKPELRIAGLMHDIGKPASKYYRNGHGWTFHGHDDKGAELFLAIAERMKWPNKLTEYVSKIIRLHHRPISLAQEEVTDSGVRRLLYEGGELVDDLMTLCRADITTANRIKLIKYLENFDKLVIKIEEVEEKDRLRNFKPPVDGTDIMKAAGITEGPEIGRIKNRIVEAILSGEIPNEREAALNLMHDLIKI
jgi:poly(A) polymerase